MDKVLLCFIIFIILTISIILSQNIEKLVNYDNISTCIDRSSYTENKTEKDSLNINGSLNIGLKCNSEPGFINVDGELLSKELCIDNLCMNKYDVRKIKNAPHLYKDKICIDSYNSKINNNPKEEVCLKEDHIKYLRNLRNLLKTKTYQMRTKMLNTKPYCNWNKERFFCGDWTGIPDDYIVGCFDNKLQYLRLDKHPYHINRNIWEGAELKREYQPSDFDKNGKKTF